MALSNDYFDSHCHLDFEAFDQQRDQLWQRCLSLGIRHLLIPGVSPEQWRLAQELSKKYKGIVCAVGIHPWWINQLESLNEKILASQLSDHLGHNKVVAVGECGLDWAIDTPVEQQEKLFTLHIQLAIEFSLPMIIHVRKAHNNIINLLKHYRPAAGGVIHGFSGSLELARQYWSLGFYLGIGGVITYDRAKKTQRVVSAMPLESLLLETDAPDMPLSGFQGQVNTPLQIIAIAEKLAILQKKSLAEVASMTTNNAKNLFDL